MESLKKQTIGTDNCYEIAMKHTTIIVQNILQDSDSLRTNLIQINSEALVPIANFCKLLIENNTATFADFQVVHNYELIADFIYLTAIPTSKQEKPKLSAIASHIATAGQTQKPFARKCCKVLGVCVVRLPRCRCL